MPHLERTNRRAVQLGAGLAAALSALALMIVVLLPGEDDGAIDPSRRGPARFLRLQEARVQQGPQGAVLVVRGETNLVAGAELTLTVLARDAEVLSLTARSDGEAFKIEAPAAGEVLGGAYEVLARFSLGEQDERVRSELNYQPSALVARRALELPLRAGASSPAHDQFRALFQEVNRVPRDEAVLDELDRRARALSERVWIGGHKAALVRVRQAIEEARRPAPRRAELDRLLVEAHLLAGLGG